MTEALEPGQYVCERCGKVAWGGDHVCSLRRTPTTEAVELADLTPTQRDNFHRMMGQRDGLKKIAEDQIARTTPTSTPPIDT